MNAREKPGQMLWKREGLDVDAILHLRRHSFDRWRPYDTFPEYALPDPPEFSKGYCTWVALLKKGWTIVPNSSYS